MAIIGIDLGTTTSEVAYINQGKASIIPNIEEENATVLPSVVLIENNTIKVGIKAKNQMILKPQNTICEIKRLLGNIENIEVDNKKYTPTQISSFILKRIKEIAEFYIGEKVEEAVITVPANFNDKQRRETKRAGELAGLKVERIINEPTAAAIAYGIEKLTEDELILVYDFGGGTFDVSIVELSSGILDVRCSRGNNKLGGKDIDNIIIEMILDKFYKKTNIKLDMNNPRILSVLKRIAEQGKKDLSTGDSTEIIAPYITVVNNEPIDLDVVIYKEEFEKMIQGIIRETEKLIDDAMESSGINNEEISKVIMVGGSTRVPAVRKMIEKRFKNKIVAGINPEETIAIGAAIQGDIKRGVEKNLVITDAASYTLGVEVINNEFDPIIKRDSKLPIEVTKGYITVEDNQEVATIRVYQGESQNIKENNFIVDFDLKGLPAAEKGKERVDITFRYDLNGMLDIIAEVASTGKNIKKKVNIEGFKEEEKESENKKIEGERVVKEDKKVNNDIENSEEVMESYKGKVKNSDTNTGQKENDERHEGKEIDEKSEEELTPEQIYSDTMALTNYINSKKESYEKELQDILRDKLADLLSAIKKNDFQLARSIQLEILELLPEEGEENEVEEE